MAKIKQRRSLDVAMDMGFVPMMVPSLSGVSEQANYGTKALVGQFVRPYKRDDGTDGLRDFSAVINAKRSEP